MIHTFAEIYETKLEWIMSLLQENQTSCSSELSIVYEKLKDKKDSENTTSIKKNKHSSYLFFKIIGLISVWYSYCLQLIFAVVGMHVFQSGEFLRPSHFSNEYSYSDYVKERVTIGMPVECCKDFLDLEIGDLGVVRKIDNNRDLSVKVCQFFVPYEMYKLLATIFSNFIF